jgi:tetratricopeptide (TPR) repeat protein
MIETVRQYAEERLNEAGESDEVRTRHLTHYVALAEKAEPELRGAGWGAWYSVFRREEENLLAAHAWCANAPDGGELALRLSGSLWRYWANTWQPERGFRLAAAALALNEAGAETASRCKTLLGMSAHAMLLGRYDEIRTGAERGLAIARRIGDVEMIIDGLIVAGSGALVAGSEAQGLVHFTEARDLAQASGDETRLSAAMNGIGNIRYVTGDFAAAEPAYRDAIRLARSSRDQRGMVVSLANLACLLIATDKPMEARALLAERMSLQNGVATKWMVPCSLDMAAALASAMGEHPLAARFHGAMERVMHEAGTRHDPVDEAFIARRIALSRGAMGNAAFDAAAAEGWTRNYDAALAEMDAWLTRPENG